ncbi:MAG: patatin family protein [Clostridia bacterium]|nr:patatin family protein [Clostridia bacterium]
MHETGLILEGGGMRCAFTAGVLNYWMSRSLYFDDVYGVSAGACQACSYLCRQPGRGMRVWLDHLDDPRFCSVRSLILTGDLFGADFNYDLLPRQLDPLDNAAYLEHGACLTAVVTNVRTGKAEYLPIRDMLDDVQIVRASASLPLISRSVRIGASRYLDGGIADSIPIKRSIRDGHSRNVLVLTRPAGYRKTRNAALPLMRLRYAARPRLLAAVADRHNMYNATLEYINREVSEGRAFVIRPDTMPDIGRIERDPEKLRKLYDEGWNAAARCFDALLAFLDRPQRTA